MRYDYAFYSPQPCDETPAYELPVFWVPCPECGADHNNRYSPCDDDKETEAIICIICHEYAEAGLDEFGRCGVCRKKESL